MPNSRRDRSHEQEREDTTKKESRSKTKGWKQRFWLTSVSCSMVVTDVTKEKQPVKRKRELKVTWKDSLSLPHVILLLSILSNELCASYTKTKGLRVSVYIWMPSISELSVIWKLYTPCTIQGKHTFQQWYFFLNPHFKKDYGDILGNALMERWILPSCLW